MRVRPPSPQVVPHAHARASVSYLSTILGYFNRHFLCHPQEQPVRKGPPTSSAWHAHTTATEDSPPMKLSISVSLPPAGAAGAEGAAHQLRQGTACTSHSIFRVIASSSDFTFSSCRPQEQPVRKGPPTNFVKALRLQAGLSLGASAAAASADAADSVEESEEEEEGSEDMEEDAEAAAPKAGAEATNCSTAMELSPEAGCSNKTARSSGGAVAANPASEAFASFSSFLFEGSRGVLFLRSHVCSCV